MNAKPPVFKPVVWIGSSRKDLREFPVPVQDHMGYALLSRNKAANTGMRRR